MKDKAARSQVFKSVEIPKVGRSAFDISYEKKLTCDMGQLIPIMCDEMVPSDHFKIGANFTLRFQPLLAPIMHQVDAVVHYFFVPYRLLWNEELGDTHSWEDFITRGPTGDDAPVPPKWYVGAGKNESAIGTIWDYVGLPVNVRPQDFPPLDFPRRAYLKIWNDYYRDENLQAEIDITDVTKYDILNCAWTKDYFTSSLLWQQKGTAPGLPIVGSAPAIFSGQVEIVGGTTTASLKAQEAFYDPGSPTVDIAGSDTSSYRGVYAPKHNVAGSAANGLDDNLVDLSAASSINVADLRLAVQLQRFLERQARGGNRYTEFLRSQYGVKPEDSRLQRPEFFGGITSRVLISEVLQTSQTTTGGTGSPLAKMAGHGVAVNNEYVGSYYAKEFGLVMGILSIRPKPAYQQGIDRQWLRETSIDFFNPLFNHLSERAVFEGEIFTQDDTVPVPPAIGKNHKIFGFQGMYSEMRYKANQICGLMRTDFDFWHLGRIFGAAPDLNASFIECIPDKRIFTVTGQPGLIINYANLITAIRPIPIYPTPGYIDHF